MSERVLGQFEFSTTASCWTEFLFMDELPDGSIMLTSKSRECLGTEEDLDGEVVWPEDFDPEEDEDNDERPWPVSIGGKNVVACEDGIFLGEKLQQHADDSSETFKRGQFQEAKNWLQEYYRSSSPSLGEDLLAIVVRALQP